MFGSHGNTASAPNASQIAEAVEGCSHSDPGSATYWMCEVGHAASFR